MEKNNKIAIIDIPAVTDALHRYSDALMREVQLTAHADVLTIAGQTVPDCLTALREQASADAARTFAVLRDIIEANR